MPDTKIVIRQAAPEDAAQMAALINSIIKLGGTTAHRTLFTPERMENHYISNPLGVRTSVALNNSKVVGFQSLAKPDPNWEGEDKLGSEWGIIATFIDVNEQGNGVGSLLFNKTKDAAGHANIKYIDATIRHENTGGLKYYSKMGFVDYCDRAEAISKMFTV